MSKHALAISPKPLVLLAGLEARQTEELSSALVQGGFRVVTAGDEREAAEAAQQDDQPHAILLDAGLGFGVCLKLHTLALATPILLICPAALTRSEQLAALRAGVRSGYSASHSTQRISPPGLLARARSSLETQ